MGEGTPSREGRARPHWRWRDTSGRAAAGGDWPVRRRRGRIAAEGSVLATIVAGRALGPASTAPFCSASRRSTASSIFLDVTVEEATNSYGTERSRNALGGLRAPLSPVAEGCIAIGVVVTALVIVLSWVLADLKCGTARPDSSR